MGAYAFAGNPEWQDFVESVGRVRLVREVGANANWNMPVCLWHAAGGLGDWTHTEALPNNHIAVAYADGQIECLRGEARGRKAAPRSDQFSLFRTGAPLLVVTGQEIRFAHLNFRDELWRGAIEAVERPDYGAELRPDRFFWRDRPMRRLLDEYLARALSQDTPSALEMDSRANLIVLALLRQHSSLQVQAEVRSMALAPARLSRVKDFVDAHLGRDLSLADIAAVAELSPFHFARAFKHETGSPPHRYLMERRVARARELLAGSELPLAEIALVCGFAGQSHFTTAFRRHTGVAPGAWRSMLRH